MLGSGIGALKVLLKTSDGSNTVWEMKGEQGDKWIQASVEIQAPAQYKVLRILYIVCMSMAIAVTTLRTTVLLAMLAMINSMMTTDVYNNNDDIDIGNIMRV